MIGTARLGRVVPRSFGLAVTVTLWSVPAFAICAYPPERSYRPGLWDAVFLGRVVEGPSVTGVHLPEEFGPAATQEVRFEVLAGWRGVQIGGAELSVLTTFSEMAPGYRKGSLFVVWANRHGLVEIGDPLVSAFCVWDDFCAEPPKERRKVLRFLGKPQWFLGASPAQRCGWEALGAR